MICWFVITIQPLGVLELQLKTLWRNSGVALDNGAISASHNAARCNTAGRVLVPPKLFAIEQTQVT